MLFSLFCQCKGTAKKHNPQEGTFWCDSYQKVGIVKLSEIADFNFNIS